MVLIWKNCRAGKIGEKIQMMEKIVTMCLEIVRKIIQKNLNNNTWHNDYYGNSRRISPQWSTM